MSDGGRQAGGGQGDQSLLPAATTHPLRFSIIWIIPVIALAIAAWLGWRTFSRTGPAIVLEFENADGITAGQTQVKHKSVGLGTVQSVLLSKDIGHVEVHVQMNAQAASLMTDHAKFWVVRPRLNGANISGLETLISGAFIAIDPGAPNGKAETRFKGLEAPPGVRSDEPGRIYTLMADSIGSIGVGAAVFFRNVAVGEVLGYKIPPNGIGPIPVTVFVRDPYDHFIRNDTRFWDVSGVQVEVGAGGFHLQLQSLQALLSGGVAFGLPQQRREVRAPEAADHATFRLFSSQNDANLAGYREHTKFVTYLQGSVLGLGVGGPVDMFGLQIGNVTGIQLKVDPARGTARVRVSMEVQPERFLSDDEIARNPPMDAVQAMVNNGMRAETSTSSLITGSSVITMAFVPGAPPVKLTMEGDEIVLPSQPGSGLSGIEDALTAVSSKLSAIPLEQIGQNLNSLLSHADSTINDPDLKQALSAFKQSLLSLRDLAAQADRGAGPLLQRLPEMSRQLQQTISRAGEVLNSYGGDSNFHRELDQVLQQLNETAVSLRTLADFLKRHPSSLLFGRTSP